MKIKSVHNEIFIFDSSKMSKVKNKHLKVLRLCGVIAAKQAVINEVYVIPIKYRYIAKNGF